MAEFSTNPGDRSVSELEREVDRERERVSATIDELQARASVGSLVDQLVKAVGENGGEVSRNLGRSLRDNPLAALLTGVGLAWLMAGSGRPRDEAQDWDDPDSDDLRYGRDRLSEAPMPSASSYGSSAEGAWPRSEYSDPSAETEEGGLRERVADVAGRVGEGVSDAVAGVRERASEMSHSAGARLARAGDTIRGAGGAVRHRAGAARRSAAGTSDYMRNGLDTLIEDQPLVAGAIAMALGAAVGGALPRSRVEDRMFGEQSDRAMETVRTLAKDQGAKVQATASAVVDEALNIADEASAELGAKLPSGEEIVDAAESKVREAASRLREASGGRHRPGAGRPPGSASGARPLSPADRSLSLLHLARFYGLVSRGAPLGPHPAARSDDATVGRRGVFARGAPRSLNVDRRGEKVAGPRLQMQGRRYTTRHIPADNGSILMRCSPDELPLEVVEQRDLSLVDLAPSLGEIEPGGAVNLRKLPHLARARWPLQRERVAPDRGGVDVRLDRPDMDQLACHLPHRSERDCRSRQREPGLFEELPVRGVQKVLVRLDLSLGDRPGMGVFVRPERAARMNEEDLQPTVAPAEGKQTCARLWH